MTDTDAEATERAEADPMGLEVLDAVDVGGTWTVTEAADDAPPPPPKPAAPTTSSNLAERSPAPTPPPNLFMPAPPSRSAAPPPRSKPAARRRRAAPAQRRRRRTEASGGQGEDNLSPDGRWWWDGRQWQPVQPAPAGAGRPGSGRWLIAAVIVVGVAMAAAVPLAIAAGTFAYRVANAPVPRMGAAPVRYLAAASSTRIEAAAVARGLRCATPTQSVGGTAPVRICQRAPGIGVASGVGAASVAMVGSDSGHLVAVSAGVSGGPAAGPTDLALVQAIMDVTVARGDAAADDAWLGAHFDQSGVSQTIVNGVSLRLTVQGSFRSLVIVPAY